VAQIIAYRLKAERLVHRAAEAVLPTPHGDWRVIAYSNDVDQFEHVALVKGEVEGKDNVFSCECTRSVSRATSSTRALRLRRAARRGDAHHRRARPGAIVYLRQEGRGIGLVHKLKAYALQDERMDTVQANEALGFRPDLRDYGIGAQILIDLGLSTIRILTNNPKKIVGWTATASPSWSRCRSGEPNPHNQGYLTAKRDKMGHLLPA
jgi:3,4-dihydroxy 2-butanone 4-phosphate synthase / GTP cyclohydrolase II